jgi:hypothetical protein
MNCEDQQGYGCYRRVNEEPSFGHNLGHDLLDIVRKLGAFAARLYGADFLRHCLLGGCSVNVPAIHDRGFALLLVSPQLPEVLKVTFGNFRDVFPIEHSHLVAFNLILAFGCFVASRVQVVQILEDDCVGIDVLSNFFGGPAECY